MMAQSIYTIPLDRMLSTSLLAESMVKEGAQAKRPGTRVTEPIPMLASLASETGHLQTARKEFGEMLRDRDHDLNFCMTAFPGQTDEAKAHALRETRGAVLRMDSDLYARHQLEYAEDPYPVFDIERKPAPERLTLWDNYLHKCHKCFHAFFGRRLVQRKATPADLNSEGFLTGIRSGRCDAPQNASTSIENLHNELRCVTEMTNGRRRNPIRTLVPLFLQRFRGTWHATVVKGQLRVNKRGKKMKRSRDACNTYRKFVKNVKNKREDWEEELWRPRRDESCDVVGQS